jgi:translation elongation factor EF-1alpha
MDALEGLEAPKRPVNRPLRVAVFSVQQKDKRTLCQGRVEYGTMRLGMVRRPSSAWSTGYCRRLFSVKNISDASLIALRLRDARSRDHLTDVTQE